MQRAGVGLIVRIWYTICQMGVARTGTPGERHLSLRDTVHDELRDQVISGRLRPGDRLVERVLADDLGVSRVPVREALRALAHEGFAEERPRRGMVVRLLDDDAIDALFEVRGALDGLVCRRLVRLLDDAGLARLQGLVDEAESAAAAGRVDDAVRANAQFHTVMVELCDSEVISAVVEPVAGRMRWLLNQHVDAPAINEEHRQILAALRSRDATAATSLCRDHLETSRAAVATARR